MEALIKISEREGQRVVSARELHLFLEVKTDFTNWIKRMLEYGFDEGKDFSPFLAESTGGRPLQDFVLILDCAKEISMLQRSEKGKLARQYFIECEKRLQNKAAVDFNDANTVLQLAQNWAEEQNKRKAAEKLIKEQKPLVVFAQALQVSEHAVLIGELAKILNQNGIDIGRDRLFEWLRDNGYLIKQKGEQYNQPTQKARDLDLIVMKTTLVTTGSKSIVKSTPKVTPKGQSYFVNKFLNAKACVPVA